MTEFDLHVELREKIGHYKAKVLRRNGKIPAIFYTHGEDSSVPLILDEKEFINLLHSEVNILNVIFPDGKTKKSILREVQRDVVSGKTIHVDLMGIKLTEKIRISIPVILTGTPIGVKEGGILEHLLREVEVEGLPLDIPEHIEVDVSQLNIGDTIKLEDISIEKTRFITDIHHALANVIHPKLIVEEVVAEEAAAPEAGEEVKEEGKEDQSQVSSKED